jgi:hypothetical protein
VCIPGVGFLKFWKSVIATLILVWLVNSKYDGPSLFFIPMDGSLWYTVRISWGTLEVEAGRR